MCEGGGALRLINSSLAELVAVVATTPPEASNAPIASSADFLSFDLTFSTLMVPSPYLTSDLIVMDVGPWRRELWRELAQQDTMEFTV